MNQSVTFAILGALVVCFLAVLAVAVLNPALVDKMTALGAGVVIGGLLGALQSNNPEKP